MYSLLLSYREDISFFFHVLLVLVLSFRTDAAARGDDKKRAEMPVKSQEDFSYVNHAPVGWRIYEIFPCAAQIQWCRQIDKKKKMRRSQIIPALYNTFSTYHFLFIFF